MALADMNITEYKFGSHQTKPIPDSVLRPGWDWHDDRKSLRRGIRRIYLIGAGASACDPYSLPTLKTLARDLYKFLDAPDRKIFVDSVYECLGVDLQDRRVKTPIDFEELLNRLDPNAVQYLSQGNLHTRHESEQLQTNAAAQDANAKDVALGGLRRYLLEKCLSLANATGSYDRLASSITEHDVIVSFNWDVLLEVAFRRQGREVSYWDTPKGTVMLKPHGSINWFALLDRELLAIDTTKNWQVFGDSLTYYMLFLRDPLGSRELGSSSWMVQHALSSTPAIIPPVASKLLSVGGQPREGFVESGHWRTMSRIWTVFGEFVRQAEELVVIGYSLPGTDAATTQCSNSLHLTRTPQKLSGL